MAAAHYRVGSLDIAIISDGEFRLDGGAVFGLVPRVLWEPIVGPENIDDQHRVPLGLNCMVVRSGDAVLVADTGFGQKIQGTREARGYPGDYGHLLSELAALGIAPEDVTAVANTHLHADHCGGNTRRDGDAVVPAFPRARYCIQSGEYEDAMHPNERTRGTYFAENFEPLEASGQLELVDGESEIIPGVTFVPTPGHTQHHASIALSSGGETAFYTGDLVHAAVQIERPAWIPAFDVLPLVSLETKKQLADRAVRERTLLICGHNTFPGVGRLTERDGKRVFVTE
jgi:glyoxylase-like metal-dependent hydrolase (beta-lactamase superfamily II)